MEYDESLLSECPHGVLRIHCKEHEAEEDTSQWVWAVLIEWGPGCIDPMVYIKSVYTTEEEAQKDKDAYGYAASVHKLKLNDPMGGE